jgi:hypothetical protein
VGVDHRRADIGVAEEFLHRADVVAVFEQVGRKRMAEGVAAGPLGDSALAHGIGHGALDDGFVEVEAGGRSPFWDRGSSVWRSLRPLR